MIKPIFGILAGILSVVCYIPYLRDIFQKKTTPHSYSWLIWSILQAVGVVAIIVGQGGYFSILGIAVGAFFCLIVFLLSLKFGTKNITKLDTASLIGAFIAIEIWIFTKDPLYSVILISVIDFLGYIPTMRKGYEEPYTETLSTYVASAVSLALALLALTTYSLTTTLYLATLVFSNSLFVLILLYRRGRI